MLACVQSPFSEWMQSILVQDCIALDHIFFYSGLETLMT